jgi:hypothetical protein
LFTLGVPVYKIGLGTRNWPAGQDNDPEAGEMHVPEKFEIPDGVITG